MQHVYSTHVRDLPFTAVSSVTIGFVIRLNKPVLTNMAYNRFIIKLTSKGGSLCKTRYSNAKSYRC